VLGPVDELDDPKNFNRLVEYLAGIIRKEVPGERETNND
jgi:hypothetical protein